MWSRAYCLISVGGAPLGSNRSPGGFEKNYTYQIGTQLKAFKSGYQKET